MIRLIVLAAFCLMTAPMTAAATPAPAAKPAAKAKAKAAPAGKKKSAQKAAKGGIKEKPAYVAEDFEAEPAKAETSSDLEK